MQCVHCGSMKTIKKGYNTLDDGTKKFRHRCNSCGKHFFGLIQSANSIENIEVPSKFQPELVLPAGRYVISSCQNNTKANTNFVESLETYCLENDAQLIVIPTYHQENLYPYSLTWDTDTLFLNDTTFSINNLITVLGDTRLNLTAENPLGGLDSLSKGKTLIVAHNQLQLKSLPVMNDGHPIILCTTGTITEPNYVKSKSGEKAKFNHSYSAIILDVGDDSFHIRVLNADDKGAFYDINGYYCGKSHRKLTHVEALITGDEHVLLKSDEVSEATYFADDSIVNTLKPKVIVRHDVLDCFTISHHHVKDNFMQYSKFINDINNIEDELCKTIDYIEETTPEWAESYVVSSNHHDHLKRWLTEANPKVEPWNAKIFHYLTYMMLDYMDNARDNSTVVIPDPFALYCNHNRHRINFINRNESFKIKDIELSNHGDRGANGSRGSLTQFAKFADKSVTGHSHTPGIDKGAYSVGTSTSKNLDYVSGPSSWMNTHCVIYPNGKRQLINIIGGIWK